jgi:hypothetical protein
LSADAAIDNMNWKARAGIFAAALWWGSLTAVGFIVVPLLFAHLPSPVLAGQTAARLFSAQTWVAVGCGVLLMMAARSDQERSPMDWAGGALVYVIGGVLLALLVEAAVAPRIVARDNLRLWHGVGSAMYVVQWICAAVALWKITSPARTAPKA